RGGGTEIDAAALCPPPAIAPPGFLWAHLNLLEEDTRAWLEDESGLAPDIARALLTQETRPRFEPVGDGALINLRGVNHNPGAEPEDMVSVRIWVEPHRVVTTRRYKLLAVRDMRDDILRGRAPVTPGDLV